MLKLIEMIAKKRRYRRFAGPKGTAIAAEKNRERSDGICHARKRMELALHEPAFENGSGARLHGSPIGADHA